MRYFRLVSFRAVCDTNEYRKRRAELEAVLAGFDHLAVAFSGGVDSSVLLHAAHASLGARAVGLIADSPSLPRRELREARELAHGIGVRLEVLRTDELEREGYVRNDGLRCYWCKRSLFEAMGRWARDQGLSHLAFGEISEDALDDRPGRRAARELRIVAPLAWAGFHKADVRRYARDAGLPVHDKPASACLASRIPLGHPVTTESLARVERAEEALRSLGLVILRVRDLADSASHGPVARVEIGASERTRAEHLRPAITAALADQGYASVELATYVPPLERSEVSHTARGFCKE